VCSLVALFMKDCQGSIGLFEVSMRGVSASSFFPYNGVLPVHLEGSVCVVLVYVAPRLSTCSENSGLKSDPSGILGFHRRMTTPGTSALISFFASMSGTSLCMGLNEISTFLWV